MRNLYPTNALNEVVNTPAWSSLMTRTAEGSVAHSYVIAHHYHIIRALMMT